MWPCSLLLLAFGDAEKEEWPDPSLTVLPIPCHTTTTTAAASGPSLPKEELANAPVPGPRMDTGPHPRGRCLRTILQVGRLVRFLNCCHVENPHYIDNYSRLTFPLSFIFINLLYWTYYLYF